MFYKVPTVINEPIYSYAPGTAEKAKLKAAIAEARAKVLDIPIIWKGKVMKEKGIDKSTGKTIIEIDEGYFRPNEVNYLCGDSSKAKKILGWKPKTTFKELVKIMIEADRIK